MEKGSRYGRKAKEEAWQSTEVDALYRLAAAGVRVPRPYDFVDGVLLMELVTDGEGHPAPRLNDVVLTPEQAREFHGTLVREVVRMLCAGVVHGDLSEYNVLLGGEGPVIIDLPQAVDAAGNAHASGMLERDVGNLTRYFGRFAPELLRTEYAKEIWSLYKSGRLTPEIALSGRYERREKAADGDGVMRPVDDARDEGMSVQPVVGMTFGHAGKAVRRVESKFLVDLHSALYLIPRNLCVCRERRHLGCRMQYATARSVFACASGPSMGCSRKCSKESASKADGDASA